MSRKMQLVSQENLVQAILVADTFEDEFLPISTDIPLCLLPVVNKPLIDYTFEFLSLGGVEETFLFCCYHVAEIRNYINKCKKESVGWTLTMKIHIIASETCGSFGDCLRDLDAKNLIRGDFILAEPCVISNISLLPLLKKHSETCQTDKGAAMTLVLQECGLNHRSLCPQDEVVIATNSRNRVLFHKKTSKSSQRKIDFPLELFLENTSVSIRHNLKDTQISICSSSVLPLFSDNFDFQTKDDFVRGILMNEEIMGSTIYSTILRGTDYGGAIHNWRSYQSINMELKNKWIFPLLPSTRRNRFVPEDSAVSIKTKLPDSVTLSRSIIGSNVKIGENVIIQDSFIFDNTTIEDNVTITVSVIGPECILKNNSRVTAGSILGKGVIIDENILVENTLVQNTLPEDGQIEDHIGQKAFKIRVAEDEDDIDLDKFIARRMSRLHIHDISVDSESEDDDAFSESVEELSHTQSPPPDDTKLFFAEVIDSLTRGFEDKLDCENLILEINSSRYAYNVTLKEVNFNVIRAILIMSLKLPDEAKYFRNFYQLFAYFTPLFKNYIKEESAMNDCLQAVEDVASSGMALKDKWIIFTLKYLYENDYLSEESILKWFLTVDKGTNFHAKVKPFTDWLQEAEEEDSADEE